MAGEVLVELARRRVEPAGGLQNPRADGVCELLQHHLVALPVERHAYQAGPGCGQQQDADGRVQGAVRNVEQPVRVGV